MARAKKKPVDDRQYEVTVWDMRDGDIVKKLWQASAEELAEVEELYSDEPFYSVQVEEI
jgi:hypothetical protein